MLARRHATKTWTQHNKTEASCTMEKGSWRQTKIVETTFGLWRSHRICSVEFNLVHNEVLLLKVMISTDSPLLIDDDVTNFRIQEPTPFSKRWYSHKFKGPGLRYEIAVSIEDGDLWTNGPFPAGQYPDLKVFCQASQSLSEPDKKVKRLHWRARWCCDR